METTEKVIVKRVHVSDRTRNRNGGKCESGSKNCAITNAIARALKVHAKLIPETAIGPKFRVYKDQIVGGSMPVIWKTSLPDRLQKWFFQFDRWVDAGRKGRGPGRTSFTLRINESDLARIQADPDQPQAQNQNQSQEVV